jgi:hypothetical protein
MKRFLRDQQAARAIAISTVLTDFLDRFELFDRRRR